MVNGALVVKAIGARLFAQKRTELQRRSRGGRSLFANRPIRNRTQPSHSGRETPETLSSPVLGERVVNNRVQLGPQIERFPKSRSVVDAILNRAKRDLVALQAVTGSP